MRLSFVKMEGTGNDYVYFDGFLQELPPPEAIVHKVADRHFGVGGDGIVYILPCAEADARMRLFNADGSEGMMCGNGIRCVGKYLSDAGHVQGDALRIQTASGVRTLSLVREGDIVTGATVNMGKAILAPDEIPARFLGESVVARPLTAGGRDYEVTCVSLGNPHCVVFVDDPGRIDLLTVGPLLERDPHFPDRVNVEFVSVESPTSIRMRVWERGSGETLACGTGACASAVACVLNGFSPRETPIEVSLDGGILSIRYDQDGTVWMTGPANEVFRGQIDLS